MPTLDELPAGPWTPQNSLQRWNDLVAAVNDLKRQVAGSPGNRGIVPGDRAAVPDIFLGYTASRPPNTSLGDTTTYTDARYYVVRSVAPDPAKRSPAYSKQGALADNLSVNDDPFNGKIPLPQYVTATNLGEAPAGTKDLTAGGKGGTHNLSDGTIVLCIGFPTRANPVKRVYVFLAAPPSGLFPVNITQSGGSNGSATTAASYTYNATNAITGASISGGPFAVTWARANGLVNAATHGTGYYNSSGTFVLWQADETPQEDTCS